MDWRLETAAVIPCLNEAATIKWLVPAVRQHVKAVCVVDDGSQDGTAEAAEQGGAKVIRHARTRGKGAALRAGWQWAQEKSFPWALNLDGDGQHSPADIPSFFRCADRTCAELTVGNRMGDAWKMPFLRRLTNRWMSRRLSLLVQRDLPDSQCGFRLMNLRTWAGLATGATHFEVESEVLVAFLQAGCPVEFVPISVIYRSERSKIHPIYDGLRWFRWWRLARASLPAPEDLRSPKRRPAMSDVVRDC